ncbi:MAG: translation initiation factor IF-3 [Hyphomicrobiales bacterium]
MNKMPERTGPRINQLIKVPEVMLVGADGVNVGVLTTADAIKQAFESGLDLVEVSPNAKPPVCKIMDYGKHKFKAQKKASEARKRQKIVEVKEVKMRPNIDTHDYDTKMRNLEKFISKGDKVKVTLRFRGREMAHQNLGMDLLQRVKADASEYTKPELEPKLEGRQMIMILTGK